MIFIFDVSTTEIGMLQKLEEEFEDRHLSIVIVGNDSGKKANLC